MRQIKTSIDIAAPPQRVWQILTDFESWKAWNDVIHIVSPAHVVGATIRFRPNFEKASQKGYPARIVRYDPNRELAWFGAPLVLPALGSGVHWFRLGASADGTLFEHGEDFRGLLIGVMPKAFYAAMTSGYESFNLALKARAEAAGPGEAKP